MSSGQASTSTTTFREGRTTLTLGVDLTGPLAGVMGAVIGAKIRRFIRLEAEGLARRAEGRT